MHNGKEEVMNSVIVIEARPGAGFVAYVKGQPQYKAFGSTKVAAEYALWGLFPNIIEAAIVEASEHARGIYGIFVNLTVCPRCNRMLQQHGPFDFGGKQQTIAICPHCTNVKTLAEIVDDVKTMAPGESRVYQVAEGVDILTFITLFPVDLEQLVGHGLIVSYDEDEGLRFTCRRNYHADK
jgi:hypothetical protein